MAGRDQWDAALGRYRAAKIIQDASENWGPQQRNCDAHTYAAMRLGVHRDGGRKATDEEQRRWEEVSAVLREQEDALSGAIYSPMWRAAAELVACPAPDLAALQIKHEVIKEEEVWNCSIAADLGVDCWAILREDVERLTGFQIGVIVPAELPPECDLSYRPGDWE